jgi:hypothetical protein
MTPQDIRELIGQLTSLNFVERSAAHLLFLKLGEDAIQPLADELYSGVTESVGAAILSLMGEIGGWEALAVLQDIYFAESSRPAMRRAAGQALKDNDYEL